MESPPPCWLFQLGTLRLLHIELTLEHVINIPFGLEEDLGRLDVSTHHTNY